MRSRVKDSLHLLKPGDWLVFAMCAVATFAMAPLWFATAPAEKAVIRVDGRIVAEYPLDRSNTLTVQGALGPTRIDIEPGRARVAADPGPRQYCVKQGWLDRTGAAAICAPSHVSLTLAGAVTDHDTVSY